MRARTFMLAAVGFGLAIGAAAPPAAASDAGYPNHAALSGAIDALASAHPRLCAVEVIGTSREGRAIHALRIARPGDVDPDRRPALLIVANIDGDHLVGSAVALRVARDLAERAAAGDEAAAAFLGGHTLYVVPRVNPDAAERYFADVRSERRRNMRADDQDRDGAIDEDPPNDLNGDGLITMMRVFDPDEADLMPDPEEPRLDVAPDRDAGERAVYTLYVEGSDDDNDGAYNEDPAGGVDLNMNFMHGYREHADGAGPHQVSEPESLALLEYVLAHQNIAVVLTYGRHDNLTRTPDAKGTVPGGAPKSIDAGDAGLYKAIGERYREITGLEKVEGSAAEGAFFAWAYAQYGVPSFATPLWTRPEPEKRDGGTGEAGAEGGPAEADDEADEGLTPSGVGDISQETLDELRDAAEAAGFQVTEEMIAQITPSQVEGFARQMGITVRRVKEKTPAGGRAAEGRPRNAGDAAWLAYSDDERGGDGFVEWQRIEHSQLGTVEVGGWAPYFRTNPPAAEVDAIAGKQIEFVLDLAGRLPKVGVTEPEVTRLASGLYEIELSLVNDGYLPTGTAMAVRNRRARPHVVRLSVPMDRIVTGARVTKVWAIAGSGGRRAFRWLVRAADDEEVTITVYSEKYGELVKTIDLEGGGS